MLIGSYFFYFAKTDFLGLWLLIVNNIYTWHCVLYFVSWRGEIDVNLHDDIAAMTVKIL